MQSKISKIGKICNIGMLCNVHDMLQSAH